MTSENKKIISGGQLMCLCFIGNLILPFAASRAVFPYMSALEIALSAVLSSVFNIVFALPVLCLGENARIPRIISFFYVFYFLFMGIYFASSFTVFVSNAVSPDISPALLVPAAVLVSMYSALRGEESIARSAAATVFLMILFFAVLIIYSAFCHCSCKTEISFEAGEKTVRGAFSFFSRGTATASLLFLKDSAHGRRGLKVVLWSFLSGILTAALVLSAFFVLGSFFNTQLFPVYALSRFLPGGFLRGGEIALLGIFLLAVVFELAIMIYMCSKCFEKSIPNCLSKIKRAKKTPVIVSSAVICVFSVLTVQFIGLQRIFFKDGVLFVVSALFSAAIPFFIYALNKRSRRICAAVFLCFISLFCLSGCENISSQSKMIVSGVYVNFENENVEASLLYVTGDGEKVCNVSGKSIGEAIEKARGESGKIPSFSHELIIFVGQGCAEDGIKDTMDFFVRYYEISPSSKIMYCPEYPLEDEDSASALMEKSESLLKNGNVKKTDVRECINAFFDKNGAFSLPVLRIREGELSSEETAAFTQGKIAAVLSGTESEALLMMLGETKKQAVVIEDPAAGEVTLLIKNIKVHKSGDEILIKCSADITDTRFGFEKSMTSELYESFERTLCETLKKRAESVLNKTDSAGCTEIFGRKEASEIEVRCNVNRIEEEINPVY